MISSLEKEKGDGKNFKYRNRNRDFRRTNKSIVVFPPIHHPHSLKKCFRKHKKFSQKASQMALREQSASVWVLWWWNWKWKALNQQKFSYSTFLGEERSHKIPEYLFAQVYKVNILINRPQQRRRILINLKFCKHLHLFIFSQNIA